MVEKRGLDIQVNQGMAMAMAARAGLISPSTESPKPTEISKSKEQDDFSLVDLNPLINRLDLRRQDSVNLIINSTEKLIEKYGGLQPKMESTLVSSPPKTPALRFVARFELDHVSDEQMDMLDDLVKETYPVKVKLRVENF